MSKNFTKYLLIFSVFFSQMSLVNAKSGVELTGDYLQIAIPVYALGMAIGSQDYEGAKEFSIAFISSQTTVHLMKFAIDAKRPNYEVGDRKDSFPSGHTASAFGGAAFIHRRYGFERAIVPYSLAAFVGYSRIAAKKHHLQDVLVGAVIPIAFTWLLVEKYDNNRLLVAIEPRGITLSYNILF